MNLSNRTKLSLCQLLLLWDCDHLMLLLSKHGLPTGSLEDRWGRQNVAAAVREIIIQGSASQLGDLVQELGRTFSSIRSGISPRYRFDERWNDFLFSLKLDNYALAGDSYGGNLERFEPIEPTLAGAEPVEDDLTKELQRSGLATVGDILQVLDDSANAFIRGDNNGCLNSARVSLQTLATSIAQARLSNHPADFDSSKWGEVVAYLRRSNFITQQHERGLTGVFSFVSPGSHTPIGFTEQEFTRLGRTLVISFCYFLVKRWNSFTG